VKKKQQQKQEPREAPAPLLVTSNSSLRVNLTRDAWADLVAHARESLEAEVCGVLAGEAHDDTIDVKATIRGAAAREARAHVTFTHETWNQIHSELDRKYPDLQIVGWYHTHPGFGVEFSAMDRFIQENFFSAKTQVAFLSDPLGSDIALACNGASGIEYLTRFFVDGREHAATIPGAAVEKQATSSRSGSGDFERMEARVNQLVQLLDEQQRNFYRMLTGLVVIVCLGVISALGYFLWTDRTSRLKPPELTSFVPVPVKVGNQTVMLGVGVVEWKVPPELDAYLEKVARIQIEEEKKERLELEKKLRQQQPRKP